MEVLDAAGIPGRLGAAVATTVVRAADTPKRPVRDSLTGGKGRGPGHRAVSGGQGHVRAVSGGQDHARAISGGQDHVKAVSGGQGRERAVGRGQGQMRQSLGGRTRNLMLGRLHLLPIHS